MFALLLILLCSSITEMPNLEDVENLSALIERIKKIDPDLYALAQNESSGGANLTHHKVASGLNKGHTAGGPWGMMPITAKETVGRSDAFKHEYPDISQLPPDAVTNVLNTDPSTAYVLAKAEYDRRLQELGGDKSRTAYSWLNGVTGAKNAKPEEIMNNPYVQKFLKNLPQNKIANQD